MRKAREDLKAIMDLLAEWREENNAGYVTMNIGRDGSGHAYSFDEERASIDTGIMCYAEKEKEPAGGNRTGSGS